MSKFFWFLSLFSTLLFSATLPYTQSETFVYIDTQNRETLDTIISKKENFTINKDSNKRLLDKPIWSYFTVTNNTSENQALIISNSLRFIRYIDALVIHEDGTKETFLIGSNRNNSYVHSGMYGYPLTLTPYEQVDIYTRHESNGILSANWYINETKEYYTKRSFENFFKGLIFGVVILSIFFTFVIFYVTKEKSSLYFSGFIFFGLLTFLSLTGSLYEFDYKLGLFFRENMIVFLSMILFFESLFIISLYRLKQNSTLLYKIFSLTSLISLSIMFFAIYSTFTVAPLIFIKIVITFTLLFTIFVAFFAIYAVYKRWVGAKFFLLAVLLHIYIRFTYAEYTDQANIFMLFPIGAILLILLLVLSAVLLKIKSDYYEKEKAEKIILNNAKYLSIGKMHAATIHQLKTPITQMGAVAARVESVFERHKNQLTLEEYESSSELAKIVTMTNNTISDLYNLYSGDQEKEHFDIKEAINEIMMPLYVISRTHSITITLSLITAPILNYPNALKHILIVILENAMDMLMERKIKNPFIKVLLLKDDIHYKIEICDNAGGVKVKPIENIFKIYKSYKKTQGLGLGLALAKDLAYLVGTNIEVANSNDGACFTMKILHGE